MTKIQWRRTPSTLLFSNPGSAPLTPILQEKRSRYQPTAGKRQAEPPGHKPARQTRTLCQSSACPQCSSAPGDTALRLSWMIQDVQHGTDRDLLFSSSRISLCRTARQRRNNLGCSRKWSCNQWKQSVGHYLGFTVPSTLDAYGIIVRIQNRPFQTCK